MKWIEMGFIVLASLIAAGYVVGGIIHMMLKAEIKDIRQELMKKDAEIRRIERRIY